MTKDFLHNIADAFDCIVLRFKNMAHWPVLPAQVVGTASNVGQWADQVVATLERRLQQHGTHLLYLLQTHTKKQATF